MTTDEIISRCYEHGQPDYVAAADRLKELQARLASQPPSADVVREALRAFAIHATYPVSTEINPRGYEWRGEDALDYAKGLANKALAAIDALVPADGVPLREGAYFLTRGNANNLRQVVGPLQASDDAEFPWKVEVYGSVHRWADDGLSAESSVRDIVGDPVYAWPAVAALAQTEGGNSGLMEATKAQHSNLQNGEPARFVRNGVLETCRCSDCRPSEANKATVCPNCNGTKRALYFGEQSWLYEERDCHVCRSSEAIPAPADDFGHYGSLQGAIAAADGNAQTCRETFKIIRRIADLAQDALEMKWDGSGMPDPADDAAVASWQVRFRLSSEWRDLATVPIEAYRRAYRQEIEAGDILLRPLFTHPAKAVDVEAPIVTCCITGAAVARKIDFWLKEIKDCNERMWNGSRVGYFGQIAKGVDELRALLTGNASSETEGK